MKYFYKVVLFIVASMMSLCMISCEGSGSENPAVDPDDLTEVKDGSLVLTADEDSFELNDGESAVVKFTALYNDKNVMSSGKFALYIKFDDIEGIKLDAPVYEMDEAGIYTFYATYDTDNKRYVSEDIEVKVTGYVAPDCTKFRKRTLATQFTGTWCGYCPSMIKLMHDFADGENSDDVVFVVAHGGAGNDNMKNNYSYSFIDYNKVLGFPTMKVGSTFYLGAYTLGYNTMNEAYTNFDNAVADYLDEVAKTGIGASSTYDDAKINIDVDIEVGQDGRFGIGVMVVEDDVYGKQENYYESNQLNLGDLDINYHDACLCISSPATKPFYESFGDADKQVANETYTHKCSFAISDMTSMVDIENCRVVVYTYDIDTRHIDNIIQFPVGESKDIEYLD